MEAPIKVRPATTAAGGKSSTATFIKRYGIPQSTPTKAK